MLVAGELSTDGKRMKLAAERQGLMWANEAFQGGRVVLKASGITGVIQQVKPWGVVVEVNVRGTAVRLEDWSWEMILKRNPRSIKRYPRPFRFPRLEPTLQCHCKGGPMKLLGGKEKNAVICQNKKCLKLIGNEAFPQRYRAAQTLLSKAAIAAKSKPSPSKRVARPTSKPKAVRADKNARPKAAVGKVVVGPAGTRKISTSFAKDKTGRRKEVVSSVKAQKKPSAQPKTRTRRPLQVPSPQIREPENRKEEEVAAKHPSPALGEETAVVPADTAPAVSEVFPTQTGRLSCTKPNHPSKRKIVEPKKPFVDMHEDAKQIETRNPPGVETPPVQTKLGPGGMKTAVAPEGCKFVPVEPEPEIKEDE